MGEHRLGLRFEFEPFSLPVKPDLKREQPLVACYMEPQRLALQDTGMISITPDHRGAPALPCVASGNAH